MKEEPKKYPIGGYAPGSYSCKCITCNTMFMGDKRAYQCEPCATKIYDFFTSFPSKQEAISCEHCGGDGIYITADSERVECPMCEKSEIMKKEPKQRTLEEAINFIAGAKWQAERMFSEQDMIEFGEWCENLQRDNKDIRRTNPDITRKELLEIWKKEFKNND